MRACSPEEAAAVEARLRRLRAFHHAALLFTLELQAYLQSRVTGAVGWPAVAAHASCNSVVNLGLDRPRPPRVRHPGALLCTWVLVLSSVCGPPSRLPAITGDDWVRLLAKLMVSSEEVAAAVVRCALSGNRRRCRFPLL